MTRTLILAAAVAASSSCASVDWVTVASNEVVTNGGDAMAVFQVSTIGVTAIFHLITIVPGGDLDDSVNKVLVAEAKKIGASKVNLISASTTPRDGFFRVYGTLIGLPTATVVGIAVK
ncbi:MAG: putative lipoprotein [Myxococcaceae bacterium]|nr:putative lipoprotein [Myxococcaceae bacterium]